MKKLGRASMQKKKEALERLALELRSALWSQMSWKRPSTGLTNNGGPGRLAALLQLNQQPALRKRWETVKLVYGKLRKAATPGQAGMESSYERKVRSQSSIPSLRSWNKTFRLKMWVKKRKEKAALATAAPILSHLLENTNAWVNPKLNSW